MIRVNAKEFSRIMHSIGLTNNDAEPGILHTETKKGHRHTVWRHESGVYVGEIQFDNINPAVYRVNDQLIPDWSERAKKKEKTNDE